MKKSKESKDAYKDKDIRHLFSKSANKEDNYLQSNTSPSPIKKNTPSKPEIKEVKVNTPKKEEKKEKHESTEKNNIAINSKKRKASESY